VYLTGVSMGGFGVWHLASRFPQSFAAIAPICGYGASSQGFPERLRALKNVPVWAFHGALDDVVHVEESERLVHSLRDFGGNARLTVYPDAGHDAWTRTYEGSALFDWFLTNKRS
jgi:predicted peptidase